MTAFFLVILMALSPLATAFADETKEAEVLSLLNWAVHLSQYEKPEKPPAFKFVEHDYLVMKACFGKECNVVGWYNDQNIVYLDKRLGKLDSLMDRSIVVHEMVHFLQHQSKRFTTGCKDAAMREREAYEIQRQFFYAYGALSPVRNHAIHCTDKEKVTSTEEF